ncbi:hypothetical protein IWQ57_006426, partial [Coemansia nantahalensis]
AHQLLHRGRVQAVARNPARQRKGVDVQVLQGSGHVQGQGRARVLPQPRLPPQDVRDGPRRRPPAAGHGVQQKEGRRAQGVAGRLPPGRVDRQQPAVRQHQRVYQQRAGAVLDRGQRAVDPVGRRRAQAGPAQDPVDRADGQPQRRAKGRRAAGQGHRKGHVPPRRPEPGRDHRQHGTGLCRQQQYQPARARGQLWHAARRRQGRSQRPLHLHLPQQDHARHLQQARRRAARDADRRWQARRAALVHARHPDGPGQRRRRHRHRLEHDHPQLQPLRNHRQSAPAHAPRADGADDALVPRLPRHHRAGRGRALPHARQDRGDLRDGAAHLRAAHPRVDRHVQGNAQQVDGRGREGRRADQGLPLQRVHTDRRYHRRADRRADA